MESSADSLNTINDLFYRIIDRDAVRVMLHRQDGAWRPISSAEIYTFTVGVARALQAWSIRPGDRIALLSENRPEWAIADFAIMLLGAVVVPIYPTLTEEQVAHILRDSGSRAIFVSTERHLRRLLPVLSQTPVEHVVVMDESTVTVETTLATSMPQLMLSGPRKRDADFDRRSRTTQTTTLATLIYTSGTTGEPKGVMLTHHNLTSNILCSLRGFFLGPETTSLSFLPLSHITARHVDYSLLYHGATLAYLPSSDMLSQALSEVRPQFLVAVPRIYEKVRLQVEQHAARGWRRAVLNWALRIGDSHRATILRGEIPRSLAWKTANRLVFSKIHEGLGGRVQIFISGGAPLSREVAEWFAAIGIRIHEGYGLTETSPVIAVNTPAAHKLGTVGKPLSNVEVRIAQDGEILVRGPSIFKGYWNKPEETAAAFENGFFKTGDIGAIDAEGFLSVTDRKKDLIKTSGGKFIAPQPIENSLKSNALISEAVVIGEKRKFPAVLIAPYFPLLQDWANVNSVPFATRAELVAHPRVQALYEGIVQHLNRGLAKFEQLKKTVVLAEEFSVAAGTLTPSLKMRRRAIEARHKALIDDFYAQADRSEHPLENDKA